MKVTIKLFATLREGRGKILEKHYSEAITVRDIVDELKIEDKDIAILLKNGISTKMEIVLSDGDILSIFPPVGGG